MLGLFGSAFGSPFGSHFGFSSPFNDFGISRSEARLINLMNALFDEENEYGFSSTNEEDKEKRKKKADEAEKRQENEASRAFSQIKQSFINGPHMIEEERHRSCDSATGITRLVTKRRLGDKWVEIEEITDKDGNKKTNEIWHNVSENGVEDFKKKWEEKRGKFGFESVFISNDEKKAIEEPKKEEQKKDEPKKEEQKKEEQKDEKKDEKKKKK